MEQKLKSTIAVITGGMGDIGKTIVKHLAQSGAHVAIGDIHSERLAVSFTEEISSTYGVRCTYTQVDVTDSGLVDAWIEKVEEELGTPQSLVVAAARVEESGILNISADDWERDIQINLSGAVHITQSVAKRMIRQRIKGRVVFMGSWAAHKVHLNLASYSVAKAGLRMLTKCFALELAPHGILVNEVAPGYVNAGLSASIWQQQPHKFEQAQQSVPLQELISTDEIAEQVTALCDPGNRNITGSTLLMDGGLSLL